MGNSLLDFVMALVRDPEAAARYAADPAGALSAAGLPGVTITDVQNLIPVVADSLAMTTPSFGDASFGNGADAVNVWTSGAAVAALDAFHVPHPVPAAHAPSAQFDAGPIDAPVVEPPAYVGSAATVEPGYLIPDPAWADGGLTDGSFTDGGFAAGGVDDAAWHEAHDALPDHPSSDHPGFDLF